MNKEKKPNRLKEFDKYADRRRGFIRASMVLSAISSILSVLPFYYIWLIVRDALDGVTGQLTHYGWMALAMSVLSIAVYILALMLSHLGAFRISKNIKKALVKHVMSLPPGTLDDAGTGRIRRVINDSVESTHEFLAHNQPDIAASRTLPLAIFVMLLIFDWRLGVASLVPVFISLWVSMSMMGKEAMQESMAMMQNSMADMSNKTVEYIRGISVVKIFQQTVDSFQNLKASLEKWEEYCQWYTEQARRPMTTFFTLINGCVAFIIAAAILIIEFLEGGTISSELLSSVVFYIIFTPLIGTLMMKVMFTADQTYRVDDALSRINGVLAMQPLQEPGEPMIPEDYTVRFEDVTFSYAPDAPPAVKGFTLEMKQGTVTALVGPSGSGKSTVAGLAARFWDPQSGRITIGGVDLKDAGSKFIRGKESYVFQRNHLIKGTLLDNVRLGKPSATPEEVSKALSLAQCDDIVAKMPKGLDTMIGPGGVYLSGGETQRVAIARAILRDAPVIILDEATAFADPENEHLIQKAFEELARDRTVLLIAHRLTTVRNADMICVMEEGSVRESGRHDDLVAAGGKYTEMWNDYQKALTWKVKKVAE